MVLPPPADERSGGSSRSSPNLWLYWRESSLRNRQLPRGRDLVEATAEPEIHLCPFVYVPGPCIVAMLGKTDVYTSNLALRAWSVYYCITAVLINYRTEDMLCIIKGRSSWAKALARSTARKGFHFSELEELKRRTWTKSHDTVAPRTCTGKKAASTAILEQVNYTIAGKKRNI